MFCYELSLKCPTWYVCFPGDNGPPQVLAEGAQSQGGDVPERARGDPGCHRARRVHQGHGAALQDTRQVCLQSTLSGTWMGLFEHKMLSNVS